MCVRVCVCVPAYTNILHHPAGIIGEQFRNIAGSWTARRVQLHNHGGLSETSIIPHQYHVNDQARFYQFSKSCCHNIAAQSDFDKTRKTDHLASRN